MRSSVTSLPVTGAGVEHEETHSWDADAFFAQPVDLENSVLQDTSPRRSPRSVGEDSGNVFTEIGGQSQIDSHGTDYGSPAYYVQSDHSPEDLVYSSQVDEGQNGVPQVSARKRLKNYTRKEDELLVAAWQNVSQDAIHGNDQRGTTYWNKSVNRFCGAYEQVTNRPTSGSNFQDLISQAMQLYKSNDKHNRNFVLLHCWTVLKNCPKWNARLIPTPATKKHKATHATSTQPINVDDDSVPVVQPTTPAYITRAGGRRKEKDTTKRGVDGSIFKDAFGVMMDKKDAADARRKRSKRGTMSSC